MIKSIITNAEWIIKNGKQIRNTQLGLRDDFVTTEWAQTQRIRDNGERESINAIDVETKETKNFKFIHPMLSLHVHGQK